MTDTTISWIERVKAADADAERAWAAIIGDVMIDPTAEELATAALIAIAAELRAQRIARRPGIGQ